MKDWSDYIPGSTRFWWRLCIALLVLFVIGIPFYAYAAETYVIPISLPYTPDSLVVNWYKDAVLDSTFSRVSDRDTTMTFVCGDDTLHQWAIKVYWPGADSAGVINDELDLRVSSGTHLWRAPLFLDYPVYQIKMSYYIDGYIVAGPRTRTGVQSYDTSFTMVNDQIAEAAFLIYWTSADTTVKSSVSFSSFFDTLGVALGAPLLPDVCRVYGDLSDLGGDYVRYAVVEAVIDKERIRDTCTGNLIFERRKSANPTGATGRFELDLIKSKCLPGAKYQLRVIKKGLETVTIPLTVPDSSTYKVEWPSN